MNPLARFSASVALTLLLGFPTLSAGLRGETTLAAGSGRFLVLFVFSRLAVRLCATLVERYAGPVIAAQAAAAVEAARQRREAAALEADARATDGAELDPIGVDGTAAAAA